MKVKSIEKKKYEVVTTEHAWFRRYSANTWENKDGRWIPYIEELEAAYQQFKNPPFEITCNPEGVSLIIKNKIIYLVSHFPIALKEDLEQALNSLMEEK
ncbi:hypothetical protein A2Z67_06075 [Candidatus Woesebacteria bacterium RBG_13_36_22]|uniref:Uncharacterized protein n=1 Tax=Candidatus Woesebacteria bacterium RBG_13_36_22 TaxID=1802478 RepID=A0A1F7X3V8_9BACT|nr:MAG: hypothetical protein A2Z67_06075 [Candidatus Woesebacteria bacterium RBG_13_36_22]